MQLFLSNVVTAFTQVVILFLVAMVGLGCHKTGIYTEKASRLTTEEKRRIGEKNSPILCFLFFDLIILR